MTSSSDAPPSSADPARRRRRDWPAVLPLYGFRTILLPTVAVSGVVFFALSLERLLRLIQAVTEHGASPAAAWGLIVFLFPHYLELALPTGFFFGVMLGVRRLHGRSELVVMRSLGLPARRLFIPIGVLAALLTLALLAITAWGQPLARYAFRLRMNAIVGADPLQQLAPGSFLSLGEDNILRANAVLVRGRSFGGFFLSRQSEPGVRDYLTAANAQVVAEAPAGKGRALNLRLTNGVLLREKDEGNGISSSSQMNFESFGVSIPLDRVVEEPGPRGCDENELTCGELLSGRVDGRSPRSSPSELRAELHRRAVNVLALPVLGFLALPLALIGQGRSARASGLGAGLVVLLIFEKTARLGKVLAETDRLSPWIGVWVPWMCLLLLAVLAYRRYSGDLARPRRRAQPALPCALPCEAATKGG